MKGNHEVMEILEAFDLTETYESSGRLAGADPKTVKHWVERPVDNRLDPDSRPKIIDPHSARSRSGWSARRASYGLTLPTASW